MRRSAIGISSILLLAGCAGPRPAEPLGAAVAPPAGWRGAGYAEGNIDPEWWSGFGDPVLSRLVAEALARNDDIAIATTQVAEARAQFRLAQAQRLPDLSGEITGAHERDVNPGFGIPEVQDAGIGLVSASYDLDLFGRLAKASAAARAKLLASQDARDSVRLTIVTSVAEAYIGLRALDARLHIIEETAKARGRALALARRRTEAGYAPQLDFHQAEAEYAAAQQLIPATELAIRQQENGLSILLGHAPGAIDRAGDLTSLKSPLAPVALPARLLRQRPDLAAAEQEVVAADRNLDSVRAAFLPDIQLTASGGGVTSTLIAQNPTSVYTLGAGLFGPILDFGRLRAQQGVAAARRDQAAYKYRKAALAAFRDVENALAAVQRTAEQEAFLTRERDAAASSLRQATERYKEGYSPYLEQIDAERSLLSTQLALVGARADRLNAAISLYAALGGGWSEQIAAGSDHRSPSETRSGAAPVSGEILSTSAPSNHEGDPNAIF